jgi:hypothetical protein
VWVAASEVVAVVWVLNPALAVVSEGVVAGIAAVVKCDVVLATGGSGHEMGGLGLGWAVVDGPGKECHHF